GPQPTGLAFITHVAAVVPRSGAADGSHPWMPKSTQYGSSWFDESSLAVVPEPTGFGAFTFCIVALALLRKNRAD
ncbi:MAG: hypothetical protein QME62_10620, partial [Armatimonadota bacterium]|nr:hypothetical protein [Armatimonadota bacterium]